MALHLWRVLAGAITILLIATHFSAPMQGIYYVFAGIVALQGVLELGMNVAVLNVSAREWGRMEMQSTASGEEALRLSEGLVAIGRIALLWYLLIAVLFVLSVPWLGLTFLDRPTTEPVAWKAPWIALVLVVGLHIAAVPIATLLEGCGRLASVFRLRFWASVLGSSASFLVIILGGGLWALAAAAAITGPILGVALWKTNKDFFAKIMTMRSPNLISVWRAIFWPMQWRLAVLNIASYAASYLLTLLLFQFHGPAVAGRFGMSWQIASTLNQLSMAPGQTRAPMLASYAATFRFGELNHVWQTACRRSLFAAIGLGGLVIAGVAVVSEVLPGIASRIIVPAEFLLLLLGVIFTILLQCQALYLRAFGREPFHVLGATTGFLIGGLAWLSVEQYATQGAVSAYLVGCAVSAAWGSVIFNRLRRDWAAA